MSASKSRYERILSPSHSIELFTISNDKIMDGN